MKNQRPLPGAFYGIGVGPGDPDLSPVKAVKILPTVDVIFAAASTKNAHSLAVDIARPHIPDTVTVRRLAFPMTRDRAKTQPAWETHAVTILETLRRGRSAAFLTLGDPLTYSTYGYIIESLKQKAPELSIVTVPGITSFQAASAAVNTALVEGEESFAVVAGTADRERLRRLADCADNLVILKAYKNLPDILSILESTGRTSTSIAVCNIGMADETVVPDVTTLIDRKPNYWTLIVSRKTRCDVRQAEKLTVNAKRKFSVR